MTENEVIKVLNDQIETMESIISYNADFEPYHNNVELNGKVRAYKLATKALEEIQQYRAIGTVEELQESKRFLDFLCDAINPNDMEKYLSMYHSTDEKSDNQEV